MSHPHSLRYALALSLLLASALPSLARAADNGIYVGGSFGDVSSGYSSLSGATPNDDHGFKAIVGARPFDWLAIEGNYADFGETRVPLIVVCVTFPCPEAQRIAAHSVSVSLLGMWALPAVDLYARVGTSRWETQRRVDFGTPVKDEGTDATYGVGLQGRLGSFALRVEFERFDFGREDADLVTAGFTYTFL